MEDLFNALERRIQTLAKKYQHLSTAQQDFSQIKAQWTREKEQLLAKQKNAIIQIEGMVARLKSIEGIA